MKKCYKCQTFKIKEDFSKNKRYKDGLHDICKSCKKESNILNKNKIKKYREENKEKQKKYYTQYYSDPSNKLKKQEYLKQYYSDPFNRERKISYAKEYDSKNKEKIKKYKEKWNQENKEYYKNYMNDKYYKDINFKITNNIRSRFYHAIKNINKSTSILKLIGCSIEHLRNYIESQFLPEMSWDNHGKIWEIDHIRSCATFDLSDIQQQKECFHYTNLQPLFKTTQVVYDFGYLNVIGNKNKNKKYIKD